MADENPLLKIVEVVLAVLLLGAVFFAGRAIYRGLPKSGLAASAVDSAAQFELNIVMRDLAVDGQTQIELYPMEYKALQREFMVNGRPGKNFDEYLAQRLRRLSPVKLQIDRSGRGQARLTAGAWWMRATVAHANGEVMEWRMPLTISQPVHTVELSGENAYERTKKF